jgi:hypothetical protein
VEETAALMVVAEIAVALAGFSGVAAALRHGASETWPDDDRDRFVDLVVHSGIALFASLVPLMFAHQGGVNSELWSSSSFIWAGCASVGIALSVRRMRLHKKGRDVRTVLTAIAFLGTLVLQLYNGFVLQEFWPYLGGLIMNLGFAFIQFMALAIPRPRSD